VRYDGFILFTAIDLNNVLSPDSFKVRSGPGVSAIKKFQITKHKNQTNHNDRNSKFQTIGF
jgi:hypothetical protein